MKKSVFDNRTQALETYLERGGLPGICMIRDAAIRRQKFEDQFETLLERDLKQLVSTPIEFRRLISLCRTLAESQGEPIDWTSLSRQTRISTPTLKKLLQALESLFLIRTVPIEGGKKGFVVWFEDQGESHYLTLGKQTHKQQLTHLSAIHSRSLLSALMKYSLDYFQYRTRGGALIPICIRSDRGVLGIMVSDTEDEMSRSEIAQAKSFLNAYSQAKIISVHSGKKCRLHSSRILSVPANQLFW